MLTPVKVRGLPGALAFGLLGSFLAHTALYGHEHAMGGAYHEILRSMVLAAVGGFGAALGGLAWFTAGQYSNGSVLATRLSTQLPPLWLLSTAAFGWFTFGESIEGHHPDPSFATTLTIIILTAWLLLLGLRAALRVLAAIVVAIKTIAFASREPVWSIHPALPPIVSEANHRFRLFARPPPSVLARA
jgi:hypothetical protein